MKFKTLTIVFSLLFFISIYSFGQVNSEIIRIKKIEKKDSSIIAWIDKGINDNIRIKDKYIVYSSLLNTEKSEKIIIGKLNLYSYSTNESSGNLYVKEEYRDKIGEYEDKLYLQILKPFDLQISLENVNTFNDDNSTNLIFPNIGINWYFNKSNINKIDDINTLWYVGSSIILPQVKIINKDNIFNKDMSFEFRLGFSPFKKNYPLETTKGLYFGCFYKLLDLKTIDDVVGSIIDQYNSYPGAYIGYQKSLYFACLKAGMITKERKITKDKEPLIILSISAGMSL